MAYFPGEASRNFFKYIGDKYLSGAGFAAAFAGELGDNTSNTFGGSTNYGVTGSWPVYAYETNIKIIAASVLTELTSSTSLKVENPYGFARNMDVVLRDAAGSNAEVLSIIKVKTNGTITLEDAIGTPGNYGAGSVLIAFEADNLNEPNAGDERTAYGASMDANDAALLLSLFQNELQHTATLTAAGTHSVSSVSDTGAFGADEEVGNIVTFDGNSTPAIAGFSGVVKTNTANTLFLHQIRNAAGELVGGSDELPSAPVNGDTYSVTPAFLDGFIKEFANSTTCGGSQKNMTATDHDQTLQITGASNAAVPVSSVMAGLHLYIEQLGGTLPGFFDQEGAGIVPDGLLALPRNGIRLVTTGSTVGNGAAPKELTVEVDDRVGTNHLPESGNMTLVVTPQAAGGPSFAAEAHAFTREGSTFVIGSGTLANDIPAGTLLIITGNDFGVKVGYPAEVDNTSFAEYLYQAFAALQGYTLLT